MEGKEYGRGHKQGGGVGLGPLPVSAQLNLARRSVVAELAGIRKAAVATEVVPAELVPASVGMGMGHKATLAQHFTSLVQDLMVASKQQAVAMMGSGGV